MTTERNYITTNQPAPVTQITPAAPSRRGAIGLALAAPLAALAGLKTAAAAPNPDAELIEACDFVVAWEARYIAALKFWDRPGHNPEGDAAIHALYLERHAALDKIDRLGARTVAGIVAMARALLVAAPRDLDDEIIVSDNQEWLSYEIAHALVALEDGGRA